MLFLPYSSKIKAKVTQATNDSSISHFGLSGTGLDFGLDFGDEVFAMADGVVVSIYNEAEDFSSQFTAFIDANDNLQITPGAEDSLGLSNYGNFVTVLHTVEIDGQEVEFFATYAHLSQDSMSSLSIGSEVTGGETKIGDVGWTGIIIGDHLHIQVGVDWIGPQLPASSYYFADGTLTDENIDLIESLVFDTGTGFSTSYVSVKKGQQLVGSSDVDQDSNQPAFALENVPDAVSIPAGPIATGINKDDFEQGYLENWDVLGLAFAAQSYDVDFDFNISDGVTSASGGSYFGVIESSSPIAASSSEIEDFFGISSGTLSGTTGSAIKTTVNVSGNKDDLYFDWYFDSGDYLPYDDAAYLVIDGQLFELSSVGAVGDYGDSGWQTEIISNLEKGDHEVGFVVMDSLDEILSSALYVDEFYFA